jgi:hypothetical protein
MHTRGVLRRDEARAPNERSARTCAAGARVQSSEKDSEMHVLHSKLEKLEATYQRQKKLLDEQVSHVRARVMGRCACVRLHQRRKKLPTSEGGTEQCTERAGDAQSHRHRGGEPAAADDELAARAVGRAAARDAARRVPPPPCARPRCAAQPGAARHKPTSAGPYACGRMRLRKVASGRGG